ncbi:uncharacterized protein MYCFIDRAFT_204961 [Pseudocercospora fijiensis CIRAD86]|uniref:Uncharacterized protein n=1 Tax=Pseudocercospora fijiensis (strain CIRAD86) TaxID=383855 RepID=M3AQZ0_PSEFD|nr:uncharacterized protein MYCFIDRAFT_204961 [Pseudocercospora fijiensis CIRAD86]EME79837.1 hypothetical protein MYCFIDRAFT_204961 [Pseudocercospora fijiensis CIRAD86]
MLSIMILCLLASATAYNPPNQIPLNDDDEPSKTITMYVTTTKTHYEFDFYTTTMVRQPRPTSCHAVETIPSRCDETACAICRLQANCRRAEAACFQCDTKNIVNVEV